MKLTSKEILEAYKFTIEHSECSDKYGLGGIYKLKITPPNGLGHGVDIKCPVCKTKEDITDYEAW